MVAVDLAKKNDLIVTVKDKNKGLAFTSTKISLKDATFENPPKSVELITDSVKVGKAFVINNIYYTSNSAELKEESRGVLMAFADYLKENPKMKIEIQGHTDNVGNPAANQALSANRAFTVKSILESFGVNGDNITAKGFGSSRPVSDNTTEAGKARNRRTEFLIVEME
jgi:outer membrane protein OmpA-like peptidoglycan-associated protein